jgi:hypothetical protein
VGIAKRCFDEPHTTNWILVILLDLFESKKKATPGRNVPTNPNWESAFGQPLQRPGESSDWDIKDDAATSMGGRYGGEGGIRTPGSLLDYGTLERVMHFCGRWSLA